MALLSKLFRLKRSSTDNDQTNDTQAENINKCLVEIKLKKDDYKLFSIAYYRGYTSYKSFLENVFANNPTITRKVIKGATKKSDVGCAIDMTYIRFYKDSRNYIDIPFEIYSDINDMSMSRRNRKVWNRENIKRLIAQDPSIRNFDEDLLVK